MPPAWTTADKLRAEIQRLEELRRSNERDWERLPRGAVLFLLAIPGYAMFGLVGAVVTLGLVATLAGIALFLIGGRRQLYADEIRDLERQLARRGE